MYKKLEEKKVQNNAPFAPANYKTNREQISSIRLMVEWWLHKWKNELNQTNGSIGTRFFWSVANLVRLSSFFFSILRIVWAVCMPNLKSFWALSNFPICIVKASSITLLTCSRLLFIQIVYLRPSIFAWYTSLRGVFLVHKLSSFLNCFYFDTDLLRVTREPSISLFFHPLHLVDANKCSSCQFA